MKRLATLLTALLLLACASAGWAQTTPILTDPTAQTASYTLLNAVTINGTAVVNSSGIDLGRRQFFGAWYLCTSAGGTPNIKIEVLQSPTNVTADFVSTLTVVAALTAETAQAAAMPLAPMRYAFVKVTGNGGNPSDTVCTVKVFAQSTVKP